MADVSLFAGDNRESLRRLIDQGVRVHSVVTDPPYGLVSIQKRFGKEGAKAARTEGNDGSFARLSGGFMGQCYHPETEVLTASGWKRVDSINIGEVVATLDLRSRTVEWQPAKQVHAYPFEGSMVHVKHRSAEQVVTPNHKIVASFDGGTTLHLTEPKNVTRQFHLFAQAQPIPGSLPERIELTTVRPHGTGGEIIRETASYDAPAFFEFLGLFLGDGFTVSRTHDHPANDFFGFSVKKKRKVEAIRDVLSRLGVKFTESPREGGGVAFYCYDFVLLHTLKPLGKAKEKHIPQWVFNHDASRLELVYRGLMQSDGCRQGKGQEVYHTSSQRLADDFQRLCLHIGRSAISVFEKGGEQFSICGNDTVRSDKWTLSVLQPGKRMWADRSQNIIDFPHAGHVYCVGVERHHTLYTRFNGKPVWSGNSWDGTGIERDPEFWKLIYDILLPGGYVFAFSGSRTGHWQACAMEMAGFIMHPMHGWATGQGFPKAHDATKAIDKHLGKVGTIVPKGAPVKRMIPGADQHRNQSWIKDNCREYQPGSYVPATPEAAQWEGWAYGTQAQKPALEPIYLGQKPFDCKTGAANLLKHGVGAVNIDATRVPLNGSSTYGCSARSSLPDSKVCTCPSHEANQTPRIEGKNSQASSSLEPDDLDDLLSSVGPRVRQAEATQGSRSDCQTYRHCDDELARAEADRAQDASTSQDDASILPVRCAMCGCIREDLSKPYSEYTARHVENKGRHPANLILDGSPEVVAMFPDSKSGAMKASTARAAQDEPGSVCYGTYGGQVASQDIAASSGSAARFFHQFPHDEAEGIAIDADPLFYHPKAGKGDRAGSKHPTVKPIALMQYLIRHITPPGGVVLDPFAGSGTTAEAARREGFDCILMEAHEPYLDFLRQRFDLPGAEVQRDPDLLLDDLQNGGCSHFVLDINANADDDLLI